MKNKLIGLFGRKQVGKDTAARIIQEIVIENRKVVPDVLCPTMQSGWYIKRFAEPLKHIVSILTGIPVASMEDEKIKNQKLDEKWKVWRLVFGPAGEECRFVGVYGSPENASEAAADLYDGSGDIWIEEYLPTLRELLELLGTQLLRDQLHPKCHIYAAFADYKEGSQRIYADGRFVNEALEIKERGGIVIGIERNTGLPESISETEIEDIEPDFIIDNNQTKKELREQLEDILRKTGIIG